MTSTAWAYVWPDEGYRAPQARAPVDGTAGPPPPTHKPRQKGDRIASKVKERRERVLAMLTEPMDSAQVGARIGCSTSAAHSMLRVMEDRGMVKRAGTRNNTGGQPSVLWVRA